MAKCPYCSAQFLNDKLLDIHTKYCKEKVSPDTSGSGYSTEKLWRSDLLAAVDETPVDKAMEKLKESEASGMIDDILSNSSAIRPLPIEDSAIHVGKGLLLDSSQISSGEPSGTIDDFYEKSRERLKFSIKPYGNILIVKIKGDLVVWTSISLNKALDKLLTSGKTFFALDVSEVNECDATGLGALFLFHQELKDKDGALALCATDQQQTKFDIIKGFTSAVSFYPNIEAAVKDLLKMAS
jgi:anti-anti-sigma factor